MVAGHLEVEYNGDRDKKNSCIAEDVRESSNAVEDLRTLDQ